MSKFKVGDRVVRSRGGNSGKVRLGQECVVSYVEGVYLGVNDESMAMHSSRNFDLLQSSPARQRTVTEIVPSVYGRVWVSKTGPERSVEVGIVHDSGSIGVAILTPPELRAAAAIFTELADALEQNDDR